MEKANHLHCQAAYNPAKDVINLFRQQIQECSALAYLGKIAKRLRLVVGRCRAKQSPVQGDIVREQVDAISKRKQSYWKAYFANTGSKFWRGCPHKDICLGWFSQSAMICLEDWSKCRLTRMCIARVRILAGIRRCNHSLWLWIGYYAAVYLK